MSFRQSTSEDKRARSAASKEACELEDGAHAQDASILLFSILLEPVSSTLLLIVKDLIHLLGLWAQNTGF